MSMHCSSRHFHVIRQRVTISPESRTVWPKSHTNTLWNTHPPFLNFSSIIRMNKVQFWSQDLVSTDQHLWRWKTCGWFFIGTELNCKQRWHFDHKERCHVINCACSWIVFTAVAQILYIAIAIVLDLEMLLCVQQCSRSSFHVKVARWVCNCNCFQVLIQRCKIGSKNRVACDRKWEHTF